MPPKHAHFYPKTNTPSTGTQRLLKKQTPRKPQILLQANRTIDAKDPEITMLITELSAKLELKQPVQYTYVNTQKRLARVRAVNDRTIVEVNKRQLDKLRTADSQLTKQFLKYAIGHELAHIKQIEKYTLTGAAKMPRSIIEYWADDESFRVTGISEREIEQVIAKLNAKFK
jgi:hypothetical protein